MSATPPPPEVLVLLGRARGGDEAARGRLLDLYRNYLRLLARTRIDAELRVRLDPSDLVQETLLEAHRDFERFTGTSEGELLAWLRRILVRNLMDQAKHFKTGKRGAGRQQSLEELLDRSSQAFERVLAGSTSTPSAQAARREQAVILADALARLPADYREVIILRNLEQLPFEEIARRLDRSSSAVRMLWARALEKLSRLCEEPP
jgi:RNA polymerase sigma-70 factor (ECF subfamily)